MFKKPLFAVLALAAALFAPLAAAATAAAQNAGQVVAAVGLKAHDMLFDFMGRTGLVAFAVVTTKATAISNADASPSVLSSANLANGNLREHVGTLAAVSGDSIGSIYRFARVRSSDRVSAVKIYCDAITTCAADVGLYRTVADGGAVVDADIFASAQSLASAITAGTEIQHESGVYGIEDIEKPLWVALGLSADPFVQYDVATTLTAAAGSAGDVSLKVQVVSGE